MKDLYWLLIVLLLSVGQIESVQAAPPLPSGAGPRFPKPVEEYHDEEIPGIAAKLVHRVQRIFSACPRDPRPHRIMVDRTGAEQFVRMAIDDWCDVAHGSE
jgi:hypothetical protein